VYYYCTKHPLLTNPEIALTLHQPPLFKFHAILQKTTKQSADLQWTNLNLFNWATYFNVLLFGFSLLSQWLYFLCNGRICSYFCIAFQKLTEFTNPYSFLLLLGGNYDSISSYCNYNATNKVSLYTTQVATVALSIYYYLQFKTKTKEYQ
jgi:hypothetical protein